MAPRGRPPLPVEDKRRRGNPGKRALPKALVALPAANGVPPAPAGLAKDGRAEWMRLWVSPAKAWLSPGCDLGMVEDVCRLMDEAAVLRQDIRKSGHVLTEPIVTPTGLVVGDRKVANPSVKMLRDAEKSILSVRSALAIPPADRARMGWAQVKTQSKLEDLLAKRSSR